MSNGSELSPLVDVPKEEVGNVVQDCVNYDDPGQVIITKQENGNYSIQPVK